MKHTCVALSIGPLLLVLLSGCGALSPRRAVRDGEAALKDHHYEMAIRHFNRAARRLPNDAMLHYNLATAHFHLGSFVPAEAALDQVLELDPNNLDAVELQGHIALHRGDWAKARERFTRCLDADPTARARLLTALANVARGETRHDLARVLLLRALMADWRYAPAHYNLALLYRDHFNLVDEAIDELEIFRRTANSQDPKLAKALTVLEALRQIQQTRAPRQPVGRRDTEKAAARARDGDRAAAVRNWPQAEKAYREALAADPQSFSAALGLGNALAGRGERRSALHAFSQAAVLNPGCADAFYQGALVALELKDLPEAARLLHAAAAKWPGRSGFFALLITLRSAEGNLAGARAYGEHYLLIAPPGEQRARYERWLSAIPADR